jgi:hypothetical protein
MKEERGGTAATVHPADVQADRWRISRQPIDKLPLSPHDPRLVGTRGNVATPLVHIGID